MSALRSSSSAEVCSPAAIPMLAVTVRRVCLSGPSLNGCWSASSRRSATSSGPAASESSSEITTNSSPPRRPSASASRTTPSEPRGDRAQQFIADAVPERVVDRLEVVEVDEQRRDRCLAAARAREHLLDAVEDQRPVREPGQRIVGRQERELLLAPRELFVGPPALDLEALAHPHEAELEAQLQDVQRLGERLGARRRAARRSRAAPRPSRCARRSSAWSPRSATPRDGPPARRRSARFPGRPRRPPRCPRLRSTVRRRSSSWRRSVRSCPARPHRLVARPAVRTTVSSSTSSVRAFSASPRRQNLPGITTERDGGEGTRISSVPRLERCAVIARSLTTTHWDSINSTAFGGRLGSRVHV